MEICYKQQGTIPQIKQSNIYELGQGYTLKDLREGRKLPWMVKEPLKIRLEWIENYGIVQRLFSPSFFLPTLCLQLFLWKSHSFSLAALVVVDHTKTILWVGLRAANKTECRKKNLITYFASKLQHDTFNFFCDDYKQPY